MYPGFTDYSAPTQPTVPANLGSPVHTDPSSGGPSTFNATVFTPTGNTTLNYSNNTNELLRLVTGAERRELEVLRELFVNIRMLDVIEKAYSFEKITEKEHYSRTETILNKIDRFIQIIQQKNANMNLDLFIQENGLDDCTWAIQRIKKNKNKDENHGGQNVHALVASVTSGFIRISDYFFTYTDPKVKDVLPMIQEQKQNLDRLKPFFSKPGSPPFDISDKYAPLVQKLAMMNLMDTLSQDLIQEVQGTNEYAQNSFGLLLR